MFAFCDGSLHFLSQSTPLLLLQNFATVKGKVTYNDQPVSSGTIPFISADNAAAYGDLKPDGSYELMTVKPGDEAAPGAYKVILVAMQDQKDLLPEERNGWPAPTVPTKYTSAVALSIESS
jgi:hypothetical protein